MFKIAKVTKHRIDRKKKKKSGRTDGREKEIRRNFVTNCYFIPWTVFTSDSTRSIFRRGLRRRILLFPPPPLHKENAVQPMNDWELERGIRFALQGIPDNFARLSDERHCLRFFCSSRYSTGTIGCAARSMFIVQKGSKHGLINNWNLNVLKPIIVPLFTDWINRIREKD